MASKYGKKRKSIRTFEQEHWYVTNIDHISLKVELITGRLLVTVIHDRSDYEFTLPDTKTSIANNRQQIDNKVSFYLDTFFQMDEFTFMQAHTDEENYTDYMNLYTDLIWVKNKLGLTIWNKKSVRYRY
tara:strand:+ start:497 stop:883 length:387 start_codon:yes stop_codon:yes gene_type:complete